MTQINSRSYRNEHQQQAARMQVIGENEAFILQDNENTDCRSGHHNLTPNTKLFDLVPIDKYMISEMDNNNNIKNNILWPLDPKLPELAQKLLAKFYPEDIDSNMDLMIENNYSELIIGSSQDIDSSLFNYEHEVTTPDFGDEGNNDLHR